MAEIDPTTGLPVDFAALKRLEDESAYNQFYRPTASEHVAVGLTPSRLAGILSDAENWDPRNQCDLFEEIEERDLHIQSELTKFKRSICALPVTCAPVSDDPVHVDQAKRSEAMLRQPGIRAAKFDILDAKGKGYSFNKIIWNRDDPRKWFPERLERWDPRYFRFDRTDGVTPLRRNDKGDYVPLEPWGWVQHYSTGKSGLPVRGGLLRGLTYLYLQKRLATIDWNRRLELFGIPGRVVNLPSTIKRGDTDYNRIKAAVAAMGNDLYALLPAGVTMTTIESSGDPKVYSDFLDHCDRAISKLINGYAQGGDKKSGTLSGGASAVNAEQAMSWDELKAAEAESLADTLRRDLVIPYLTMTPGGKLDEFPMVEISAAEKSDNLNFLKSIEVAAAVKAGTIDREAGIAVLVETFNVSLDKAERLLGAKPAAVAVPALPVAVPAGAPDDAAASAAAAGDVQATALNGAQVDALLKMMTMVANGELPAEAVRPAMQAAFPLIDAALLDRMMAALAAFKPTPAGPPVAPPPPPPVMAHALPAFPLLTGTADEMREQVHAMIAEAGIDAIVDKIATGAQAARQPPAK